MESLQAHIRAINYQLSLSPAPPKKKIEKKKKKKLKLTHLQFEPFLFRERLTDVLRVIINNSFKENFMGKIKKKTINVLTAFSISYKNCVNFFKINC